MPKGPMKTKAQKREGVAEVMGEFKRGTLRSGSKKGPKVTSPAQAKAIAMSETGQSRKKKAARKGSAKRRMPMPMSDASFGVR